jgi:hypothetical protein
VGQPGPLRRVHPKKTTVLSQRNNKNKTNNKIKEGQDIANKLNVKTKIISGM